MPSLLSGSILRSGGSGEFIKLQAAQPQLPPSPSTSTGYTVITNDLLQTTYSSSLGNIQFYTGTIYSNIPTQPLQLIGTGSLAVIVTGGVPTTNTATGALVVEGGIGVRDDVYIGRELTVVNTATINGNLIANESLQVTGIGTVNLSPQAGTVLIQPTLGGTVQIEPNLTGNLDNMVIGQYVPENANFLNVYSPNGNTLENNLLYTPQVTVSISAPSNPRVGDFWINPIYGVELQYIKDGTSTFWIQFTGF
jgi:hypothetical protein